MMRHVARIATIASLLASLSAAAAESMIDKLLRVAGLTATPAQMRGPGDDADAGDIWIADLGGAPVSAMTAGGGYRSPIFSSTDGSIVALKGETLVRIPSSGGSAVAVQRATGVLKLVGFDARNPDEIVVVLDGGASPLGVLSMSNGKVMRLPFDAKSEAEQRMLAQIRGQERVYGDAAVYVKTESKRGLTRTIEWTDVYYRGRNAPPRNISACDGVNCGQPALSPDGRRIAFVKTGG
jgi:hypothetical protein